MCKWLALMAGMVMALTLSLACCPATHTRTDAQNVNSGPYPEDFRDIVTSHMADIYPHGQVLRNIIIHPPSPGQAHYRGQTIKGHIGLVDFSLRKDDELNFRRVTFCYFLDEGEVVLFEEQKTAQWCMTDNNEGENQ